MPNLSISQMGEPKPQMRSAQPASNVPYWSLRQISRPVCVVHTAMFLDLAMNSLLGLSLSSLLSPFSRRKSRGSKRGMTADFKGPWKGLWPCPVLFPLS